MSYSNKQKNEKENKTLSGLSITGGLRVFPQLRGKNKDYLFFGSSFKSSKSETRLYYDIQFTNDNKPNFTEPFNILINKAFFTVDEYKGNVKLKLVVIDFDLA